MLLVGILELSDCDIEISRFVDAGEGVASSDGVATGEVDEIRCCGGTDDEVGVRLLSIGRSETTDDGAVVLVELFMYLRGVILIGRWLKLVVVRGSGADNCGADVAIVYMLSNSSILLGEDVVASISVVDVPILLSAPTDFIPDLPSNEADKVTPEVPLSTANIVADEDSMMVVVSVEVLENGPEGVKV